MATKKKPPLIDVSAMEPIPKPKTTTEHPNKKQPPKVVKNVKKPVAKMTDSAKKRVEDKPKKSTAQGASQDKVNKAVSDALKPLKTEVKKVSKAVDKVVDAVKKGDQAGFKKADKVLQTKMDKVNKIVTTATKTAGEGRLLTSGEVAGLNKIFKAASQKAAATPPKPAKAKPKDVPDVRDLIRNAAKEAFK